MFCKEKRETAIWMTGSELDEWVKNNPRIPTGTKVKVNSINGRITNRTSLHNMIGDMKREYEVIYNDGRKEWVEEDKIILK